MSFEGILFYLTSQQAVTIYFVVFISAFIENIFPPFPGDIITLVGAFLAGYSELGYIPLFVFVVAGGMSGAMLLYYLGRTKGRSFFIKYDHSYLKVDNLHRIESWFKKWGFLVLLLSRFIAGFRSVVAISAGIGGVPTPRMAFFTLISFCLWNTFLIGGMFLLRSNWQELVGFIGSYNTAVIIISALVITIWLVIIYRKSYIKK
jgi:membrane protein DedA with SNARE-associated domain